MILYALALLGAVLGAASDVACLLAARGRPLAFLALGAGGFALCAPIWLVMVRRAGGSFTAPAAAWATCSAVLTIATWSGDRQSPGEKVGFVLIVLGVIVRAVSR